MDDIELTDAQIEAMADKCPGITRHSYILGAKDARAAVAADRAKGGEAVAWMHHYRQVPSGGHYEQADIGDCGPDPREGWKWVSKEPLFTRPSPAPETREGKVCSCCTGKGYFAADANCPQCKGDGVALSPSPAPTQATQDAEQAAMWRQLIKWTLGTLPMARVLVMRQGQYQHLVGTTLAERIRAATLKEPS